MKTVEWGFLIVNYLFLGGLSAGLFFVSALATVFYKKDEPSAYTRIARLGALLAPWPVMIGCVMLIFDLGHWYRFYRLFLHLRLVSPMSIGSWLLVFFNFLALAHCYAWLTEAQRTALFGRLPRWLGFLHPFNCDIDHWRRRLALLGLPVGVAVGIYTGVLLGAVQSRPFWNTNLVAQLFLFSALSTGCAALILGLSAKEQRIEEMRLLYALDVSFMTLELFVVIPYIIHGQLSTQAVQNSLGLILGGPFTALFWLFFVGLGLLTPLVIEVRELVPVIVSRRGFHYNRLLAGGTALLILGGGFLLRYIFVFAGQMSAIP